MKIQLIPFQCFEVNADGAYTVYHRTVELFFPSEILALVSREIELIVSLEKPPSYSTDIDDISKNGTIGAAVQEK